MSADWIDDREWVADLTLDDIALVVNACGERLKELRRTTLAESLWDASLGIWKAEANSMNALVTRSLAQQGIA